MIDIDAELRFGQVFHMADRGHDIKLPSQIFFNRLRFGRGFDNHQRLRLRGRLFLPWATGGSLSWAVGGRSIF